MAWISRRAAAPLLAATLVGRSAAADDGPYVWVREYTAATVHPTGLLADLAAEVRAPVLRFGGAVFNDTFVGTGARLAASPTHIDTALRLTVQPIDLLPITIEGVRSEYWESPFGLVPMASMRDTTSHGRDPLYAADADFAAHALALVVSPTLQAKGGPLVAFSNWTVTFRSIRPISPAAPWVFEPVRGMVVGYDDRLLEHTSAVLWEALDGEERPLLRVGPVLRGKSSKVTPDATLQLGALVQFRPDRGDEAPTMSAIVTEYLIDPDYVGLVPNVALVVTFVAKVPVGGP